MKLRHLKKRLSILLAFCLLFTLVSCTKQPYENTPSPERDVALVNENISDYYIIPAGEQNICVDKYGNEIMRGKYMFFLVDLFTNKPMYIVLEKYISSTTPDIPVEVHSALYSLDGTLLIDWMPIRFSAGFDGYIVAVSGSEQSILNNQKSALLHPITHDVINMDVISLRAINNSYLSILSSDNTIAYVINSSKKILPISTPSFPYPYTHLEVWNDYYIASYKIFKNDESYSYYSNGYALLDSNFQMCYDFEEVGYPINAGDDILILSKTSASSNYFRVFDVAQNDFVFSGKKYTYYDGALYIETVNPNSSEPARMYLATVNKKLLTDFYSFLIPSCDADEYYANYFYGVQENSNIIALLNREGTVLKEIQIENAFAIYKIASNRFSISARTPDYPEDAYYAWRIPKTLVDENLEEIPLQYQYYSFQSISNQYIVGMRPHPQNEELALYDVLDFDGNIILESASYIFRFSDDYLVVNIGTSAGIINNKGEWVYKTSFYAFLEDEKWWSNYYFNPYYENY